MRDIKIIDINNAKADLIANTINFINDSRLKSETKRFIEDLVDQKILGSNFENIEITNRENKNSKKTQKIDNTSQNKSIPDPGDSSIRENINDAVLKEKLNNKKILQSSLEKINSELIKQISHFNSKYFFGKLN